MSVPAITNGPWVFDVNNDCSEAAAADTKKHALWQLKESLKGFTAWSVVASSDSSAVKNIGDAPDVDLWAAWSGIVGAAAGVAHSWIILENSVTGEQICIDVASASFSINLIYSATGAFAADGTVNNRPTDTESQVIIATTHSWYDTSLDGAIVHCMISADDKITRWYIHQRDGSDKGGWFVGLEEVTATPAVWTSTHKRCVFHWTSNMATSATNTSKDPTAARFLSGGNWYAYLKDATPYEGWDHVDTTSECYGNFNADTGLPQYKNNEYQTWLGGYPVSAIGFYRNAALRGGGLGKLQDIYAAHQFHDTYDTYDGAGSREFIKLGCFMVPWNGTAPVEVP